jgi:hypothetical protein
MTNQRIGIVVSAATLLAVALAGCTMDGLGVATGTLVLCVQDEPTVNFNGVFVNFGNVQINTLTSGDNTINDNDTFNDGGTTGAATTSAGNGTMTSGNATAGNTTSASASGNATTSASPTTSAAATNGTMNTTAAATGAPAETIQVSDVECSRTASAGNFDFDVNGQRNMDTGDGENPGQGDENRGRSDSPCDRDQGFGNDWKCEDGKASKDIEVEAGDVNLVDFQDNRAAFLAKAELPPITIDDACVTIDDVRVTMNATSNGTEDRQVEIQMDKVCVEGPIEIREGQQTLAVLKVDLEQSLRDDGSRIVFVPVVHIRAAAPVMETITIQETETAAMTTSTSQGNMTTGATNETMGTSATASNTTTAATTTSSAATTSPAATTSAAATTSPGP